MSDPITTRALSEQARAQVIDPTFSPLWMVRARELANLFGGNGMSTAQQIEIVAVRLREWSGIDARDLRRAA